MRGGGRGGGEACRDMEGGFKDYIVMLHEAVIVKFSTVQLWGEGGGLFGSLPYLQNFSVQLRRAKLQRGAPLSGKCNVDC